MIAYKLLRVRKNGTIGPLFINKRQIIEVGRWLEAEEHLTKGFTFRPGWHCTTQPKAPHLKIEGRRWYKVEIEDFREFKKPEHQGGVWLLSKWIKVIEPISEDLCQ
jgi:hypothetical protein